MAYAVLHAEERLAGIDPTKKEFVDIDTRAKRMCSRKYKAHRGASDQDHAYCRKLEEEE